MLHEVLFAAFMILAVVGGLVLLTGRRPTVAGASLIFVLFAVSGICMMLDAHLLATLVLVAYAGSLLVVLGLMNRLAPLVSELAGSRWLAHGLGGLGLLGVVAIYSTHALREAEPGSGARTGLHTLEAVGVMLVTSSHFLSLLVTGLVFVLSVVGALLLARRVTDGAS